MTMKYMTTILMSLLLLGVCSARILRTNRDMEDKMMPKEADQPTQDIMCEGEQCKAENLNSNRMSWLRDTVYQKIRNVYQQLNGKPYNHYLHLFEEFPQFPDPLEVGSTVDQYEALVIHYYKVQFQGLNTSSSATLRVDTSAQTAVLVLSMKKAEISGYYNATDNNSGYFNIKMAGHLTYVYKFQYGLDNSTYVQLMNTSGEMYYNSYTSDYENIGTYPPAIQKDLQFNLWKAVNEKVRQELYATYADTIRHLIQDPFVNDEAQEESVEKVMRKGINDAVNGIQKAISKHGVFSIDLSSDNQEMMHNKLHAKIASIKLNGIERFYLAGSPISDEVAGKVVAKVELAVNRPTASAIVSIHEANNEDAPFQKINVDFEIERLMADLLLYKSTRKPGLELRGVQTKINHIWPASTEKFEGKVSQLIKEKLTGHMKSSIEEGLKNFLQNKLSNTIKPVSEQETNWGSKHSSQKVRSGRIQM